jgi:hypothetical protein
MEVLEEILTVVSMSKYEIKIFSPGFIDVFTECLLQKCSKGYHRTRFIQLPMAVNRRLKLFPLLIYLMSLKRRRFYSHFFTAFRF